MIAETETGVWVQLAAEAPDEMQALEDCAARGAWTNGRGLEAIPRLRHLAAALGVPVQDVRRSE